MTWLDESKRIPSSGVVGLGVKGIGSLSPTFSTLTRGISPTDLVKASIFSTSLMLPASGMGCPLSHRLLQVPHHSTLLPRRVPLHKSHRRSSACWRKAGNTSASIIHLP